MNNQKNIGGLTRRMTTRVNYQFQHALYLAEKYAARFGSTQICPEHVLLALLNFDCAANRLVAKILPSSRAKRELLSIMEKLPPGFGDKIVHSLTKEVIERATTLAVKDSCEIVGSEYLLLALSEVPSSSKDILETWGCTEAAVHALMPSCSPS